jgi:drug/metabolite transporter (DMT)-like permease
MVSKPGLQGKVVLGIALAIILDTATQLSWKVLALEIPTGERPAELAGAVLSHPLFYLLVALIVAQLVNWLKVLNYADLSFAKPLTSLSKVSVCILSAVYLHEHVGPYKIAGIAIVLLGVWCVCQTESVTTPKERAG